jgi:hypothetical protein
METVCYSSWLECSDEEEQNSKRFERICSDDKMKLTKSVSNDIYIIHQQYLKPAKSS